MTTMANKELIKILGKAVSQADKYLSKQCEKRYFLTGSKMSHYDFKDGSRLSWHAATGFKESI